MSQEAPPVRKNARGSITYLLYNIIIALALLQRPKSNPGKQIWQILLLMLTEDEQTYHMIHPDWQNSTDREEMP